MSLTIKAFLHERWGQDAVEIRRFAVDQDVTTSYAYLTQKIAAVFPALRAENVVVAWTDDEGDLIVISSDEELVEALDQFEGTVFHLHLKKRSTSSDAFTGPPREPQPTLESEGEEGEAGEQKAKPQSSGEAGPSNSTQGTFHPGVICDGCSGPIYGTRYKCLVCADYDLCSGCEGKGTHVDHNMVSIVDPYSYHPWGVPHHRRGHHGFGACQGRGWGGQRCGGRGGRRHCGGGGGWHGGNFGPAAWGPFGAGFGGGCGGGFGFPFAHPYFSGGPRGGCGRFNRGGRRACGKETGKAAEPMDTEQKASAENEQQQTPEEQQQQQREFLQGIGQAVSSFLEPFGVKVDVGVAANAPEAKPTETGDGVPSGSNADTTAPKEREYNLDGNATAPPPTTDQWEFVTPGEPQPSAVYSEVLAQLQTMGFDDEGGWLSELVKAKGGDIGKVLDALNPSAQDSQ